MKIAVLGDGVWGKALAGLILENNPEVIIVGPNDRVTDQEILINAVPAQFMREAFSHIPKINHLRWIINTAKGIEQETYKFPFEMINEFFPNISYATLSGPSFANEVVQKMPTVVNLASSKDSIEEIKQLFSTSYFKVVISTSYKAIELAAVLKNVYAIGCGISDGLGYKFNTRTRLMLMALDEIKILNKSYDFMIDQEADVAILGDLMLTCNSESSRNFKFGTLLATKSLEESLKEVNSTVEGYNTIKVVDHIIKTKKLHLPFASFIVETIHQNNPSTLKSRLMSL